jgi:signal peptidase I
LLAAVIHIWNLFDAYRCAKRRNPEDFENSRNQNKDPWLAVFLSDLLPGLGQIYIKKWLLGIVFIVCFVALLNAKRTYPSFSIVLWAIFSALICYHAYISAPIRREVSKKLIVAISIAIFGCELSGYSVIIVKKYFVEAFQIPSVPEYWSEDWPKDTGMEPTLQRNDRILVRKYVKYKPKQGDVVVFKSPDDPDVPWVKRAVALGGESVEIKDGGIFIGGNKLGALIFQNIELTPRDKFGVEGEPFKVPAGCIFVLGDNSKNSNDSRFYGAIPESDLIGKAYKIYWPPKRMGPIE